MRDSFVAPNKIGIHVLHHPSENTAIFAAGPAIARDRKGHPEQRSAPGKE
ncbi:MAG: hypothetical protein MZU91_11765 [Desulfosudis oleivorans]|nr:hypothetical protein [Desulfosudis oleivorans]